MEPHAGVVRSADGTGIGFERSGSGRAVVMIDPAGGYSGFDNIRGLGALLSAEFTVYTYDRRGRGDSGSTPPYAIEREVEDIEALVDHAGALPVCTASARAGYWRWTPPTGSAFRRLTCGR
jgi:pimeloyl-ACP methyl ester carboxylesterase